MLVAQITDLHMRWDDTPLSGAVVTRPYIAAAVDQVNAWAPDATLVTGDLTDIRTAEEYALLRTELDRLAAPYFVIPGNHDRREELRQAFSDHAYLPASGRIQWVIEEFPLRLIGLDSVVPGSGYGELSEDSLNWLDKTLSADPRPTLVAIHHPPFRTGILGMDRIMCRNGDAMADVIARHPHVERVVAGHHHRPVTVRWAGTVGQIAPSVAHQVNLDFTDREIAEWVLEPPAILLHSWDGEMLISHTAYIGDFGGPQPFRLDPGYPGGASNVEPL
ncbi:MAG: phosphodiesterase [Pseudomonadota bacterium]